MRVRARARMRVEALGKGRAPPAQGQPHCVTCWLRGPEAEVGAGAGAGAEWVAAGVEWVAAGVAPPMLRRWGGACRCGQSAQPPAPPPLAAGVLAGARQGRLALAEAEAVKAEAEAKAGLG